MTIPVKITFRHMESSAAVEARVHELAGHLGVFSDRIQFCRVVVDSPHRHHHQGKVFAVKVHLEIPGEDVVVFSQFEAPAYFHPRPSAAGEKGYDPEFGARPLRRVITNMVEDRLSDAILANEFDEGDTVIVDVNEDREITLRREQSHNEPEEALGPPADVLLRGQRGGYQRAQ